MTNLRQIASLGLALLEHSQPHSTVGLSGLNPASVSQK